MTNREDSMFDLINIGGWASRGRRQLYHSVFLRPSSAYDDMSAEQIARQQMAEREAKADPEFRGNADYAYDGTIENADTGAIYGTEPGSVFKLADPDLFCGMVTR